MLVAIADSKKSGVQALADPGTASAVRILAPYFDIPESARESIRSAVKDTKQRGAHLMSAYWHTWPIQPMMQVVSRLLVNPPDNLDEELISASQVMTLTTVPCGNYGPSMSPVALTSPLRRSLIHSETHPRGYFDDITVFWDGGIDLSFLVDYVLPGSTLTFIRPELNLNADWLEWGNVDLDCRELIDAIQAKFNLTAIVEDRPETPERQGGVRTIYGICPKTTAAKAP